jgi:hypothetical protein
MVTYCPTVLETIADDDPSASTVSLPDTVCLHCDQEFSSRNALFQHLEQYSCHDPDLDQGRDSIDFLSPINSVDVNPHVWAPSADVLPELSNATPEPTAPIVDDDPDAPRAQINTGVFVSVTDQLHIMLHDYAEFSSSRPCPVKLLPPGH